MELKNMNTYILESGSNVYKIEYIGQKRELEELILKELEHDGKFKPNRFVTSLPVRKRLIRIIRI